MIEILKKMFEDNPEKSTLVLKEKCSDCGIDTSIEITPTSSGFGLQGGVLFKSSNDKYTANCPSCYEKHFKMDDNRKSENKCIKILLVEDELTSRMVLNSFLQPIGEVDVFVNGNEALTAFEKAIENNQPYELIFLDIMLPELDGIGILEKIRQLETRYEVREDAKAKVIMTSANTGKDVILKAARAGCTSYLIKPIDQVRLYNEIRKHGLNVPE
jgi:two-component system, chemotaxis family, chemotaxis protein CheY